MMHFQGLIEVYLLVGVYFHFTYKENIEGIQSLFDVSL